MHRRRASPAGASLSDWQSALHQAADLSQVNYPSPNYALNSNHVILKLLAVAFTIARCERGSTRTYARLVTSTSRVVTVRLVISPRRKWRWQCAKTVSGETRVPAVIALPVPAAPKCKFSRARLNARLKCNGSTRGQFQFRFRLLSAGMVQEARAFAR